MMLDLELLQQYLMILEIEIPVHLDLQRRLLIVAEC